MRMTSNVSSTLHEMAMTAARNIRGAHPSSEEEREAEAKRLKAYEEAGAQRRKELERRLQEDEEQLEREQQEQSEYQRTFAALRQWTTSAGQPIGEPLPAGDCMLEAGVYSLDGQKIFAACGGKFVSWGVDTGQRIPVMLQGMKEDTSLSHVAFISADGRFVVAGSYDVPIRTWELGNGEPLGEPVRAHQPSKAALSADGRLLVTSSSLSDDLRILEYQNRRASWCNPARASRCRYRDRFQPRQHPNCDIIEGRHRPDLAHAGRDRHPASASALPRSPPTRRIQVARRAA